MKKRSGLLALLLISTGANAAQQFTYSGDFISGTGGIVAGNTFSGQFTFNVTSPNENRYSPGTPPSSADWNLKYWENTASSLVVNGLPFDVGNHLINISLQDNLIDVDDATIAQHGLTGYLNPGIYDFVGFEMGSFGNQYASNSDLLFGMDFSVGAVFRADKFTSSDIQTQSVQSLLASTPELFFFEVDRKLNDGTDFHGSGIVRNARITEVAAVPLPGAFWLFGSAIAGLALRLRRSA